MANMLKIRGIAYGGGVVLGAALIIRGPGGLAKSTLSPALRPGRHAQTELPDVVILTDDYQRAANAYIPWVNVVGIAVEHVAGENTGSSVPVVFAASDLFSSAQNGDLVLLDGERGIVVIAPDGPAIAAYQAERERLAPRNRVHLGHLHEPAISLDGRVIRVMARITTLAEARNAVDNGADALYMPENAPLLPADADDADQLRALYALATIGAGKPITIAGTADSVSLSSLLRTAHRANLSFCAPLTLGADWFEDLRTELATLSEELLLADETYGDLRISGRMHCGQDLEQPLELFGVYKISVELPSGAGDSTDWLQDAIQAASELLLPVEAITDLDALHKALACGAAGVAVGPEQVQGAKEVIRGLDIGNLRGHV